MRTYTSFMCIVSSQRIYLQIKFSIVEQTDAFACLCYSVLLMIWSDIQDEFDILYIANVSSNF